jgi:YbbR domain-containing protein
MLDLLLRRLPLKLLAFAIAFAIWLAVVGENKAVQDFRVPLDVVLRPDAILEGQPLTAVNVRLRGAQNLLQKIAPFDLQVRVDLKDADFGERNLQLAPEAVLGRPPGVEVVLIDPGRLALRVAKRVRKVVPVAPEFVGRPAAGHEFYWAETSPDTVEIEGPEAKIADVQRLRTDPIRLDGRTQPFLLRVAAVPDSPDIQVRDARPISVRAHVDVAPVEVTFDDVPVSLAGRKYAASAAPSSLRVTIAGPPALVARIHAAQIRAVADLSGLEPSALPQAVPVRIDFRDLSLPDLARITVRSLSRSKIEVLLSDRRTP